MRFRTALLAIALIAAACGDDDAGTATTAAPTTQAATSQAPTTAAATTEAPTTTDAPTTTEAVTTTEDLGVVIAAMVEPYVGGYEGTWNNTTFGSEGDITGNLAFDAATQTITLDLDIGGFVFGAFDPEPETFVLSLADVVPGAGVVLTVPSETFGDLAVTLTADGLEFFGADVPDPGIASIRLTGPVTPGAFDLAYVIEFEGGGGAEGTVTLHQAG
ncbi:MAG: hypothetical protein KKE89_08330 [Actinobacteria bacterium]|nr:hypothetical protein [Actinomycetota bacterium]MBU1866406.1 hypothetical protein [Actinomycetota bacterium]